MPSYLLYPPNKFADYRKLQPRLLSNWKYIPIEIAPKAAPTIKRILITLGSPDPVIRQGGSAKAGPVVTDNGMWIMDAPFPPLKLASDLKDGEKGDKNGKKSKKDGEKRG